MLNPTEKTIKKNSDDCDGGHHNFCVDWKDLMCPCVCHPHMEEEAKKYEVEVGAQIIPDEAWRRT